MAENNNNTIIVSGSASVEFAKNVATCYGVELGNVKRTKFSDGEIHVSFEESVRGKHVYIIQPTISSDSIIELLLMIDAAKRASAYKVVAVIPYFGYARQDRKDKPRVPIGAKLMAKLLDAAKVDRIITMDLHADQIQGFFSQTIDHLFASSVFIPYIINQNIEDLMIIAPDTGSTKRANNYASSLNTEFAICYKKRSEANKVDSISLIGDVYGKNVIIVDDIIDTGGTLIKAVEMLYVNGAKSVSAMITHAVLSGDAYEKIENSNLNKLITTDSIPLKSNKPINKIEVVSIANLFAVIIKNVQTNVSISTEFIK